VGDLEARIKAQKKTGALFSKDIYTKWIAQLLCGLHHIHQNTIIHRDIKSQNIFLRSEGNLLIGDFGVSKMDNIAATFIGSPYYVSPEMVAGKKYSKMTDIWSLGVLFYEIVTLGYPFHSRSFNQFDIQEKILRGHFTEPPQIIDPVVRQMIRSMLVVNPQKRVSLETLLGRPY
jgi:NIMA (never in mitosis gene a)-related kinase